MGDASAPAAAEAGLLHTLPSHLVVRLPSRAPKGLPAVRRCRYATRCLASVAPPARLPPTDSASLAPQACVLAHVATPSDLAAAAGTCTAWRAVVDDPDCRWHGIERVAPGPAADDVAGVLRWAARCLPRLAELDLRAARQLQPGDLAAFAPAAPTLTVRARAPLRRSAAPPPFRHAALQAPGAACQLSRACRAWQGTCSRTARRRAPAGRRCRHVLPAAWSRWPGPQPAALVSAREWRTQPQVAAAGPAGHALLPFGARRRRCQGCRCQQCSRAPSAGRRRRAPSLKGGLPALSAPSGGRGAHQSARMCSAGPRVMVG